MAPHVIDQAEIISPAITPESRLSLDPVLARQGIVDGGWWPHSRNARVELPKLISSLNEQVGEVLRLGVDARDWDEIPRRIAVGGHSIRVGWFRDANHKIIVTRGPQDHILLLIVPPRTSPASAKSALAMAAAGKNRPEEILAASGIVGEVRTDPPQTSARDRDRPRDQRLHPPDAGGVRTMVITDAPGAEPCEIDRWCDDGASSLGPLPARQRN